MAISLNEIKERLKDPISARDKGKAIDHEQRLRFHTETHLDPYTIGRPLSMFLDWVKTLIPKDKFQLFGQLFKFPVLTTELVDEMFKELEKIFNARNSSAVYQFADSTLRDDWEYYRQNNLGEPDIWHEKGWQKLKTAINSILVVDMPAQESTRPDAYFYWLGMEHVVDFMHVDGVIQWLMFKQDGNRLAVFDDESYRVFELNSKNEIVAEISNNPHQLGYCPASFFWSTSIYESMPSVKKSPLTKQLSNLDWYLFFSVSKRVLDLYAPYPIYSSYAADCDFKNEEAGYHCDGGFLRHDNGDYIVNRDGSLHNCPVCAEKRLVGVGSFVEVPVPQSSDDVDLRNPVNITTVDIDSLKFNVDECNRLRGDIYSSVVGRGGEQKSNAAINEMQVTSNFESKNAVLNSLKVNFERAQLFVDETICKLRYGGGFISASINWGTEFYIYTIEDLYASYKMAKENGASEAELDALGDKILETEYKNNPLQLQRMLILKHLEPYRHYTRNELITLNDKGLLDKELFVIKINFNNFVDRFERENTNIIEFGSAQSFDTKINTILSKFKEYGKTKQAAEQLA